MSNVVVLHGSKRWKAVIEYDGENGLETAEHYFEEVSELHLIIEHGKDWNRLVRCVLTLNRTDSGDEQNHMSKAARSKRTQSSTARVAACFMTVILAAHAGRYWAA